MTKGEKNINNLPQFDPVDEIRLFIKKVENELLKNEFILAHNLLKKAEKLIIMLKDDFESTDLKNKLHDLRNELNIKILTHIQENRKSQ
jgi:hypothetical protein